MFSIEISNRCVVQLDVITNAATVQARLNEAFEAVMAEFTNRDLYRRAAIEAAAEGTSRTQAGEQTAAYHQYRSVYAAAATLAALHASRRNRTILFPPTLYRRRRSHSFLE